MTFTNEKIKRLASIFHSLVDMSLDEGVDEETSYQKFEGYMNGLEIGMLLGTQHEEFSRLMLEDMSKRRDDAPDLPSVVNMIVKEVLQRG